MFDKKKLKQEIEVAFADVPYPGDDNIVSHHCLECDAIAETFKGKRWQDWKENPLALIARNRACISFFSPEAFHFYLPLCLFACIDYHTEADVLNDSVIHSFMVPRQPLPEEKELKMKILEDMQKKNPQAYEQAKEALLSSISPSPKELHQSMDWHQERITRFSPQQIKAIKSFLRFMKEEYKEIEADSALQSLPGV